MKNYKKLDDLDIIPNVEPFECIVCYLDIEPGDGVVLRECLHTFCKCVFLISMRLELPALLFNLQYLGIV